MKIHVDRKKPKKNEKGKKMYENVNTAYRMRDGRFNSNIPIRCPHCAGRRKKVRANVIIKHERRTRRKIIFDVIDVRAARRVGPTVRYFCRENRLHGRFECIGYLGYMYGLPT